MLVSPEPATVQDLARAAGVPAQVVDLTLDLMARSEDRGWTVIRHNDTAHLSTSPRWAAHVRHFLRIERESRLSGAAMETLTLIAYRQPVTRAEIDALRGVDSVGVLATLHARGLVENVQAGTNSRRPDPVSATTLAFLQQFGLASLEDLPPLDGLAEDARARSSPRQRCPSTIRQNRRQTPESSRTLSAASATASMAMSICSDVVARPTVNRNAERALSVERPIAKRT